MMRNYILSSLLALAFLGCAGSTIIQYDAASGKADVQAKPSLFAHKLGVGSVKHRDVDGFLEVQAELVNKSSDVLLVEAKAKWYDAEGWEISDPKELWREVIITGNETKSLKLVAPAKGAASVRIMLRPGNFKSE